MYVQELSEPAQIAIRYNVTDLQADIFDFAQAPDNGAIVPACCLVLFLQDGCGIAHLVGIEQQNVLLEIFEQIYLQLQTRSCHCAVLVDIELR